MASLSVGPQGAQYTISPRGNRATAGLTGTSKNFAIQTDPGRIACVRAVTGWKRYAESIHQSGHIKGAVTVGALHDRLNFRAVLVVVMVGEWRQRYLRLTRLPSRRIRQLY